MSQLPIVYVRGYAGPQSDVEETVDDPMYGFNTGSTHIRLGQEGEAEFFMFVSPLARLFRDHGYQDVIDGAVQQLPPAIKNPKKTIWIYRYYDPTSQSFHRPGGKRLSIQEAAEGLKAFIDEIRRQVAFIQRNTGQEVSEPTKVALVAHSMGGLVCRCLLETVYECGTAQQYVDKFFTYGTPHGGIHFAMLGGYLLESMRDLAGVDDSDNFGREKMYRFLTPKRAQAESVPQSWDPKEMNPNAFPIDRIFCIIGTNASDYLVAKGLSKTAVGPQSDGLVQIDNAYLKGAHRAYIHRSHSGRYGMVNSEEGYQNLQRFLFGQYKIAASLGNFSLDFSQEREEENTRQTYFFETQIGIRGLPVLMHERSLMHFCADAVTQDLYESRYKDGKGSLPLFTSFLFQSRREDRTIRYFIRLGVYQQLYKDGLFVFGDHLERLPIWSDYLIMQLEPLTEGETEGALVARYCWNSQGKEPNREFLFERNGAESLLKAPLAPGVAATTLGENAIIEFRPSPWL